MGYQGETSWQIPSLSQRGHTFSSFRMGTSLSRIQEHWRRAFVASQVALKAAKEQREVLRQESQQAAENARWNTTGSAQEKSKAIHAARQRYAEELAQAERAVERLQAQSDQDWETYEAERLKP